MLLAMKREEIEHLASLARIKLTEAEIEKFPQELSAIVSYVSAVSDIVSDTSDSAPQFGPRHNVFRKDDVTNEPDEYTEAILAEMPTKEGRFLSVKKILQVDE